MNKVVYQQHDDHRNQWCIKIFILHWVISSMHVLAWVFTIEKVLTEKQSNMMKIKNNLKKKSNLITQCLLHTIHSDTL